jgi:N6-L-threonylcarbamoyladenine synthase
MVNILGIETSCDETSASIVCDEGSGIERIKSNIIRTQIDTHAEYGGVVPEIAARMHVELLFPVIKKALKTANISLSEIDAFAATCGPGLIGGLIVGAMSTKTLALVNRKPFIAINHLEGHVHICRIIEEINFPYLLLLISGGHCQLLEVYGIQKYKLLGDTLDDSAGETFDKIARLLDMSYPGGPYIEQQAKNGDPNRFNVSIPLKDRPGCDFSFSGIKTAFRLIVQQLFPPSEQDIKDVAASLQKVVIDTLENRIINAIAMTSNAVKENRTFVVAGGVAANKTVQQRMCELGARFGYKVFIPPLALCTDNAAMIAWVGLQYFLAGHTNSLDFDPRPRWNLPEIQI